MTKKKSVTQTPITAIKPPDNDQSQKTTLIQNLFGVDEKGQPTGNISVNQILLSGKWFGSVPVVLSANKNEITAFVVVCNADSSLGTRSDCLEKLVSWGLTANEAEMLICIGEMSSRMHETTEKLEDKELFDDGHVKDIFLENMEKLTDEMVEWIEFEQEDEQEDEDEDEDEEEDEEEEEEEPVKKKPMKKAVKLSGRATWRYQPKRIQPEKFLTKMKVMQHLYAATKVNSYSGGKELQKIAIRAAAMQAINYLVTGKPKEVHVDYARMAIFQVVYLMLCQRDAFQDLR